LKSILSTLYLSQFKTILYASTLLCFKTKFVKVNVGVVLQKNPEDWTEKRICEYISDQLPSTRRITGKVYFLEKIPHNPQGKKLRSEMKNLVQSFEQGTLLMNSIPNLGRGRT